MWGLLSSLQYHNGVLLHTPHILFEHLFFIFVFRVTGLLTRSAFIPFPILFLGRCGCEPLICFELSRGLSFLGSPAGREFQRFTHLREHFSSSPTCPTPYSEAVALVTDFHLRRNCPPCNPDCRAGQEFVIVSEIAFHSTSFANPIPAY